MVTPSGVTYGDVIYPPGGTLGPRPQRYYQLVLVYAGQMSAWIDGAPLIAGENTTTLLFPGHTITFKFDPHQETHHAWMHLTLPDLPEAVRTRLGRIAPVIPLSSVMHTLMEQLLTQRASTLPTASEISEAIALQMFWQFVGEAEQLPACNRSNAPAATVEKAQYYINYHVHESLTLSQIAQSVSMSPTHLIRLFKRALAMTPMDYLWQQRVKMGIELLEQTGLSVKEISVTCGFKTSFHFSRRVKEATGCTPTQLRQRANSAG